jgi:AAA family ATP:ADP antiporter
MLSRLFNVRPNEWARLLFLYGMGVVFLIGLTWGETIADALFLSRLGVENLPILFVLEAVITIFALAIFSAFADRVRDDVLLIAILILGGMSVLLSRILAGVGQESLAFPMLYLASRVIRDTFNVQFWTYVNGFYDTRSAKRVIPIIATAARVAGAIAGLTMPVITSLFSQAIDVSFAWISTLLLMAIMVWMMPRLIRDREQARSGGIATPVAPPTAKQRSGIGAYVNNIREGYGFVAKSPFLRWMAASTILLIILTTLITFQGSAIFVAELKDEKVIADYLGTLTGVTNLIMLPIQLLFLGRIVQRLGLGTANLIYPLSMLGICGGLILFPRALISAAAQHFARTTFRTAFRNTLDNLMYNAVPLRVKGRARAFIGGLVMPIGTIIGGGLLLLRPLLPQIPWLLPTLIGVFALAYAISAFVLRRQYSRALVSMLAQEDYSFLLATASDLAVTDSATLNFLKNKLQERDDAEHKIFMAQLILEIGGKNAVPLLAEIARENEPAVRATIADLLGAADLGGDEVRRLLTELLSDPDGGVRRAAVRGLMQYAHQNRGQFNNTALMLLSDPDLRVRLEVAPTLLKADAAANNAALQMLAPTLAEPDPSLRASAVQVLGKANQVRFIANLLPYLDDPSDEVRLAAVLSIEELCALGKLPDDLAARLRERLDQLLTDPIERVRRAALTILAYLKVRDAESVLVRFLADPSADIRAAAVESLVRLGRSAVAALTPLLERATPTVRLEATVALSRIMPDRAADRLRAAVQENLIAVHANYVRLNVLQPCADYRSLNLLCSLLRERSAERLDAVFYLLSAVHDRQTVQVIRESLNNPQARVRANALEALESLLSPQIVKVIAPLYDLELTDEKRLRLSQEISGVRQTAAELLQAAITEPNDDGLRAIVSFALGEIAPPETDPHKMKTQEIRLGDLPKLLDAAPRDAAAPPAEKPIEPPAEKPAARRGRRGMGDLLGALGEDAKPAEQPAKPAAEQPAEPPSPPQPIALTPCQQLFSREQISALLLIVLNTDASPEVRAAAQAAQRLLDGIALQEMLSKREGVMLSTIEKIIFLKEVSFFEGMTVDQLKVLASVAEERLFSEEAEIFAQGAPSGVLYVIVRGKVALEREGQRKGSSLRIATLDAYGYFGEMGLFDESPTTERAFAVQDTLCLALRREPLIELTRRYPDLSLRLINVLSRRLREANDRIAQLTTTRPRELHKVFDKLE